MKNLRLLIVIVAASSIEACATVPQGPPKLPVTNIHLETRPAEPIGNVIPVMFTIDNRGETWVRGDRIVLLDRQSETVPPLPVQRAASEAGGADKLTKAITDESATSTVSHAFLRDSGEGIGAGLQIGASMPQLGPLILMAGTVAGLGTGLVHGAILAISEKRRQLYELRILQLGESFGESIVVAPGQSAHGYLFFEKQDYKSVKLVLPGHDSHGNLTCETIEAPWGRDWHSEPGATTAVDKNQCYSQ